MLNDDTPPIPTPPTSESPRRFRDETLLVLLTVVAVAGIALINVQHEPRPVTPMTVHPVTVRPEPAAPPLEACADCGEVIGIHESSAKDAPSGAASNEAQISIDVRMLDGSLRTIKQSTRNVDVGDHVRVNGNALSSRS